jgi:hypothetical protein
MDIAPSLWSTRTKFPYDGDAHTDVCFAESMRPNAEGHLALFNVPTGELVAGISPP